MSYRFKLQILLIVCCVAWIHVFVVPQFSWNDQLTPKFEYQAQNAHIVHAPLYITNDAELEGNSTIGTGDPASPYLIQEFLIETTATYGIYVSGTTKSFIIQNCIVNASSAGIYLNNIPGHCAAVRNNTCYDNAWGICLASSSYVNVSDNICYDNSDGIYLESATYTNIWNNTCRNGANGIYTWEADYSNFTNNWLYSNSQWGITLDYSDHCIVEHNFAYSNSINGIYLAYSDFVTVSDNECHDNIQNGIYTAHSQSLVIQFNVLNSNYRDGFLTEDCTDLLIVNNTFYYNHWIGCQLSSGNQYTCVNNSAQHDGFDFYVGIDALISCDNNTANGLPLGFFRNIDGNSYSELEKQQFMEPNLYGQLILFNSSNLIVSHQEIHFTSKAVTLYYCVNVTVQHSNLDSNNYGSVFLWNSQNCSFLNLSCSNNAQSGGFYLLHFTNCSIRDCVSLLNEFGIFLHVGSDFQVINCSICFNSYYNMRFQSVSIGNITNNSIYKSDNWGLLLYDCDNTTLSHNLFLNNSGYAIEIDSEAEYTTIHHNTIIDNGGTSSQAKSDSALILWHDLLSSEGNFWSDWSKTGSYLIDGLGFNEDLFPLETPPTATTVTITTTTTTTTTTTSSSSSTTNSTTTTTTTSSPGPLKPWMIALITIVGGGIFIVIMVIIVKKKKKYK